MPLYIPWLTETIKKRGVRYLLHHYLGQFFEEKLTLEQLSIDIYEGKGSIRDLALDVDGLNDELDFIPFKFLEGCSIGQISVEVPWSSLITEACRVELEGAKFVCRLKTSCDSNKAHFTESTLLSRSLMTSSMQMAEDIVTTEDDEDYDSPNSSLYKQYGQQASGSEGKKKDNAQMFEGLEMFAQLIDSVLRRTKLTAYNTLFQIEPHPSNRKTKNLDGSNSESDGDSSDDEQKRDCDDMNASRSEGSDSREPNLKDTIENSNETVEFLIKFFRCEEIIDRQRGDGDEELAPKSPDDVSQSSKKHQCSVPETVTKLLTLEDVEMRIGGIPVSNLVGKHTVMIKFNGQKSEISIYSGSPLLAVIGHEQLKTFFKVFDSAKDTIDDENSSHFDERNQKVMGPEDYARIENQLLESANLRTLNQHNQLGFGSMNDPISAHHSGRRWVESGNLSQVNIRGNDLSDYNDYHPTSSQSGPSHQSNINCSIDGDTSTVIEPSLNHIEAFSCELKLPGIWLCLLKDGETIPDLIKPYADSINSFETVNKYIDKHIKRPHIRILALKVALDLTSAGINVFLGDLDISEHLMSEVMSPTIHILQNDLTCTQLNNERYKATIVNNKNIVIDSLTKTRITFDPTLIDRLVLDYKLFQCNEGDSNPSLRRAKRKGRLDLNVEIRGEQLKLELLCPIPDLTPEAHCKVTQLRPQSFIFDIHDVSMTLKMEKFTLTANDFVALVKTQPMQKDSEAVRFIESTSRNNDKIVLTIEPSPSNLDDVFPNEVDQALNESSMYDSLYISKATESRIPTDAFHTKRKVVRASIKKNTSESEGGEKDDTQANTCDSEKILTPGDRQHLLDYLNQTVMSTKLSINLNLPVCEVEFEDKEQLDLIYNRFGNDFVFWHPKSLMKDSQMATNSNQHTRATSSESEANQEFKDPVSASASESDQDDESDVSYHSLGLDSSSSDIYANEVTCKIIVDELFVKFNHQGCAAALKQEISSENVLLGIIVDVNKRPNTVLSLVADNLELTTDSEYVLERNCFNDKTSSFGLTAEIKRPTKALKDIKLAIQLVNGLFFDFRAETYKRFWKSISVTDEPILGYVAPKIVTELHVDLVDTALILLRDGARPALFSVDELYLTSMVMEQTSQAMIRVIADELSLYLKKNRDELDIMKNYVCLIDSGLIDLDIGFSQDGQIEFGLINNKITVRACQDSLSALFKLFSVLIKSPETKNLETAAGRHEGSEHINPAEQSTGNRTNSPKDHGATFEYESEKSRFSPDEDSILASEREMDLIEDAMNDYKESPKSLSPVSDSEPEFEHEAGSSRSSTISGGSMSSDRTKSSVSSDAGSSSDGTQDDVESSMGLAGIFGEAPNHSLLDESNPTLNDLFSPPLLPWNPRQESTVSTLIEPSSSSQSIKQGQNSRQMDESDFFMIGDDDVGAGIMDKRHQQEPVVRKLIEEPITVIENYFKMTRPRTIPEILAASLERYVLEEMTLVVILYGGRDFDDEPDTNDETGSGEASLSATAEGQSESDTDPSCLRKRTGSLATGGNVKIRLPRRHFESESSTTLDNSRRRFGQRRERLSSGLDGIGKNNSGESKVRFGGGAVNLWESLDLMSVPDFIDSKRPTQPPLSTDLKQAGGIWRQNDVSIQLTLSKVKFLYEIADTSISPISWRFMLFIQDIEIKDRVSASDINKILYEYCSESMPRRNTQLLTIKNIATVNPSDGCEECDLRISLKPLRLNIDQDTLLFMIEFFTSFTKTLSKQQTASSSSSTSLSSTSTGAGRRSSSGISTSSAKSTTESYSSTISLGQQLRKAGKGVVNQGNSANITNLEASTSTAHRSGSERSSNTVKLSGSREGNDDGRDQLASSSNLTSKGHTTTIRRVSSNRKDKFRASDTDSLPTRCHTDSSIGPGGDKQQPIYIKSFTFSPDVPIRLDYHAKHLDFEQGALAGILMGLAHLDHSELVLHRVQAKHGMRGLDRVLLFALNHWMQDIKRNQLPSILSGVGPMHSVIQLFQGIRDLFWMPIDHYRRDRRLVRGLQRGAASFSSSTAMAAISLMNRFISIIHCTAQIAHDIVAPPTLKLSSYNQFEPCESPGHHRHHRNHHHHHHSRRHTGSSSASHRVSVGGRASLGPSRRHLISSSSGVHGECSGSSSGLGSSGQHSIQALNQPRNFCEGVAVGFNIIKEGFNDTARNVVMGMQAEDMRSAVGELVRQIPSTLLNPIITATEGAQNVLVGMRNQIAPDARREDQDKWKRRIRGR